MFAVTEQAEQHDRPGEIGWLAEEQRALALALGPEPEYEVPMLLARDGARVIGAASLELSLDDNLHLAEVLLAVHPGSRRRGVGSTLLAAVEQQVKEAGRTTVLGQVDEPPGGEEFQESYACCSKWLMRNDKDQALNYEAPKLDDFEAKLALVKPWFERVRKYKN